jgi:dihydroorotate dehydrogenase
MYQLIKPLLFCLPPETAHRFTLSGLDLVNSLGLGSLMPSRVEDPVEIMGLTFANRVGLAAGLDKNGEHIDGLSRLGFGFLEVGTVTPRAQPGNPVPRMFRLKKSEAIINRMGFNNAGVEAMVEHLKRRRYDGVLGVNIGKNFDTPIESAVDDYKICLQRVYRLADYITVNISSPNTPGLRSLQNREELARLLVALVELRNQQREESGRQVPLAIKIAPDLTEPALREMAQTFLTAGVDGVIATNTTIEREGLAQDADKDEAGGLSGAPLTSKATEVVAVLADEFGGEIPIIAAGGVMSPDDATAKLEAGASLVQLYTGLIYRGPGLVRKVASALAKEQH